MLIKLKCPVCFASVELSRRPLYADSIKMPCCGSVIRDSKRVGAIKAQIRDGVRKQLAA